MFSLSAEVVQPVCLPPGGVRLLVSRCGVYTEASFSLMLTSRKHSNIKNVDLSLFLKTDVQR